MTMKKFYVGVKAVIRDEDKGYLLLRRSSKERGSGFWDMPGGRMEDDETSDTTLIREVSEEIGGRVLRIGRIVGTYRLPQDVEPDTGLLLIYFLVEAELPDVLTMSDEHDDHVWVKSIEDLPTENINPTMTKLLKELLS